MAEFWRMAGAATDDDEQASTVTARVQPVADVTSASGALSPRRDDHDRHRRTSGAVRSDRTGDGARARALPIREGLVSLVLDAHDVQRLHQRVPDRAPGRHPARFSSASSMRDGAVAAQRSGALRLRSRERRRAPARDRARSQPHAAGQRRRSRPRTVAAHPHGRARRPARRASIRACSVMGDRREHPVPRCQARAALRLRARASPTSPTSSMPASGCRSRTASGCSSMPGSARARLARESRAREAARRADVLQLQPAPRSDERLRGELPLLLVRAAASPATPQAYTMSLEQVLDKLRQRAHQPLTEVHVVNGLHPDLPFDVLPRSAARPEGDPPRHSPEVLHRGRDRVLRRHVRHDRRGRAARR